MFSIPFPSLRGTYLKGSDLLRVNLDGCEFWEGSLLTN